MDYQKIIDRYYPEDNKLKYILITHSRLVSQRALKICDAHPELGMDRQFIEEAAMLHDIGICRCDAPGIECFGTEPYICHGRIGATMLRAEGLERHARVCERHTGAGLTKEEIYADKFYSKTHPEREKSYDRALKSVAKFGDDGARRFKEWTALFEPENVKN